MLPIALNHMIVANSSALALIELAKSLGCGGEAIVLIPRVMDRPIERTEQRALLKDALVNLQPILQGHGIVALIEPLGFVKSSLRFKSDVVSVLDEIGNPDCFGLIHDTFHHALSNESNVYADVTRIVHVSGVADPTIAMDDMTDAHRGLVDEADRLGNIEQIRRLMDDGFSGPFSFEAFSPEIHELTDPANALSVSTAFINSRVAQMAA
ncbi:MAG: TIM barrel protein [Planktomarina sp.]